MKNLTDLVIRATKEGYIDIYEQERDAVFKIEDTGTISPDLYAAFVKEIYQGYVKRVTAKRMADGWDWVI
jgi:hypothetical protein